MTEKTQPDQLLAEPKPDSNKQPEQVTSKEEIAALFSMPATYINHFYAAAAVNSIRLTFAEKDLQGEVKVPRFNCLLTLHGLQELHNLTGSILSNIVMQQAGQVPPKSPAIEKEKLN